MQPSSFEYAQTSKPPARVVKHMSDGKKTIKAKPSKTSTLDVQGTTVSVVTSAQGDYISLTDMLRAKDGDFFISDWLRNRNTVEFLGIWESIYNPAFNCGEFATIKSQAGLNSYKISVKEWVEKTGAIGLKDEESNRLQLGWNLQRTLSKINYRIHTDAIKEALIPPSITQVQTNHVYASDADLLNVALFGQTAKQWQDTHPDAQSNQRDNATLEQLVVMTNLESLNAVFIPQGLPAPERLQKLNENAITQMRSLLADHHMKRLAS